MLMLAIVPVIMESLEKLRLFMVADVAFDSMLPLTYSSWY